MADQPAATSPPATADPQDPLPESAWFWRRVFVFVFGGIAVAGVGVILWMIFGIGTETLRLVAKLGALRDVRSLDDALKVVGGSIDALASLGFWLIILVLADRILYLIAPSAEQAAKMMATVSAWKSGVSTSSSAQSTAPDGSSASASQQAGPAVTPPVPPTPPVPQPPKLPIPGTEIIE